MTQIFRPSKTAFAEKLRAKIALKYLDYISAENGIYRGTADKNLDRSAQGGAEEEYYGEGWGEPPKP